MYLYKKEAEKLLSKLAHSTADVLEAKVMFLIDLLNQDDWTFVIKAHALIETAVTQMLVERLGETQLMKVIELLPLSDNRTGKLAVARQLNLLDDRQRRFIRLFSELRNNVVHRFENLNFNFEAYFAALETNQRRNWKEGVTWFCEEDDSRNEWEVIFQDRPKLAVYMALHCLVAHCVLSSQQSSALREINEVATQTTKTLLES